MITHTDLVNCAVKWLRTNDHKVYFAEPRFEGHKYSPDALGWSWRYGIRPDSATSTLIECKASRSDFLADRKKLIHDQDHSEDHPGDRRFFMVPESLRIDPTKLPYGWGLIEVDTKKRCTVKLSGPNFFVDNGRTKNPRIAVAEQPFLLSALRRTFFDVHFDTDYGRFETVDANNKRKAVERLQVVLNARILPG